MENPMASPCNSSKSFLEPFSIGSQVLAATEVNGLELSPAWYDATIFAEVQNLENLDSGLSINIC